MYIFIPSPLVLLLCFLSSFSPLLSTPLVFFPSSSYRSFSLSSSPSPLLLLPLLPVLSFSPPPSPPPSPPLLSSSLPPSSHTALSWGMVSSLPGGIQNIIRQFKVDRRSLNIVNPVMRSKLGRVGVGVGVGVRESEGVRSKWWSGGEVRE